MSEGNVTAPAAAELTQDERSYAGLAHALMMSTWWIGPLVIYLMKKQSRFVAFHSLQALFWQIIFTALYVVGMAASIGIMLSSVMSMPQGKNPPPENFPIAFFIAFPITWLVFFSAWAITVVLGIVFCLKAMRGEWAAYPLIGRWARRITGV